jgi:hypothetical protein
LFVDSTLIYEALPSIPSIVVDYVKYDSLEYISGKDFGVRLNVVSNYCIVNKIEGSFRSGSATGQRASVHPFAGPRARGSETGTPLIDQVSLSSIPF